jgi:RecB family exonuclease
MTVGEDAPKGSPLPVPERMSYSQFEAFEKCPLQYKFEHIYRIPKAGNANKSFGQSVHNALHEAMSRYMARTEASQQSLFGGGSGDADRTFGKVMPAGELLEIYAEKWIDDWYDSREQMDERFAKGKEALLRYHSRIKDAVVPVHALEQPFSLKLDGVTVKGRIDRIDMLPDGTVEIVDYKTGKSKDSPDKSQLFIYQLAALRVLGLKPSKLTFVYLEGDSEYSFLGEEDELAEFEERLSAIAAEVRKSSFGPTPDRNTCRYCDFKDICEFSAS